MMNPLYSIIMAIRDIVIECCECLAGIICLPVICCVLTFDCAAFYCCGINIDDVDTPEYNDEPVQPANRLDDDIQPNDKRDDISIYSHRVSSPYISDNESNSPREYRL